MLRRQRFIISSVPSCFYSSSSCLLLSSTQRFISSNNNNNNNKNKTGTNRGDIYFVSQNGNYFFTDVAYSCMRNIRNTLMSLVPTAAAMNNGKKSSNKKSKKKVSTPPPTPVVTNSNASSLSYADMKIASEARNLHAYKPTDLLDAISTRRLRSYLFSPKSNNKSSSQNKTSSSSSSQQQHFNENNQPPLPSSFGRRKWWYAMMPTGYPHSVSQGFARFFLLNLFGAALAAFSLTLATQALLSSFFSHGTSVGWLLKDILPAFLTAYLAHTFINVETHPREWFIVANVITQGAVGFDFMIPFIAESSSGYFSNVVDKQTVLVGLATISSFAKGLAMLILTTSRTALVQSFSREGNLVELSKRLHGMIIFIYPTASGVALAVAALVGSQAHATIATLVTLASLGVVCVAVTMVRNLYPRLLNVENSMESCRRFLGGTPVVKAAEAPSVALFARRVYRVPFRVGFDLEQAIHRAKKYKEAIAVVSFNDDRDFHKAKYLFVFRRPASSEADHDANTSPQYYTMAQIQQLQAENRQRENDIVNPRKFVGILFDVHATFSDVMEGLLAAIMFREHDTLLAENHHHHHHHHHLGVSSQSPLMLDDSGSSGGNQNQNHNRNNDNNNNSTNDDQRNQRVIASNLSNEYCHADLTDAFPLSRKKGNELLAKWRGTSSSSSNSSSSSSSHQQNNNNQQNQQHHHDHQQKSPRVFLKRPKPSQVHSLIQQLSHAGWQTRPHQIDNRDYRIEIQPLILNRNTGHSSLNNFGDLVEDEEIGGNAVNHAAQTVLTKVIHKNNQTLVSDDVDEQQKMKEQESPKLKMKNENHHRQQQLPSDAVPLSAKAKAMNPNTNSRILKNAMNQVMSKISGRKTTPKRKAVVASTMRKVRRQQKKGANKRQGKSSSDTVEK